MKAFSIFLMIIELFLYNNAPKMRKAAMSCNEKMHIFSKVRDIFDCRRNSFEIHYLMIENEVV